MRVIRLISLLLCLAAPVAAQQEADDQSFLERQLQSLLSDAGRDVSITGFAGALSSNATLQEMTISDADGVWFTMSDASLKWTRSALLRGRLEVEEISAAKITVRRLPKGDDTLSPEDAEATPFALPELPVAINIGAINANLVVLETPVLGQPATLSLDGNVTLEDGAADVALDIRRTDRADALTFGAGFDNTTRVLMLTLDLSEAPGGLVSELLRIPDAPSLSLQVAGDAPLSDYTARITLTSDGTRRIGGTVKIAAVTDGETGAYTFSAGLNGDIRPLVTTELHPFFGAQSTLDIAGQTRPDGGVTLDSLSIGAAAMQVAGSLDLAANGWPDRFRLAGKIGNGDGPVTLPFGGSGAEIVEATFDARYDATQGESWQAAVVLQEYRQDMVRVDRAAVNARGMIERDDAPKVTADIEFDTSGLGFDDPDLMRAVGTAPSGQTSLVWQQGGALQIESLALESGDMSLTGSGRIEELAEGFPVTGRATVQAGDLRRFAALAGRDLSGAMQATVTGSGTLLGGAFDIILDADTTDLTIGEPRVDPVLAGNGQLSLKAKRDTDGTEIERLSVNTPAVTAQASGRLNAEAGHVSLIATMPEIATIEPRLSGPATIDTALDWQVGGKLSLARLIASAAGANLTATGALWPDDPMLPAEGDLTLRATDLSRLSALAGRKMSGALDLNLSGSGAVRGQTFDLIASATAQNVRTGLAELDRLAAGDGSLDLSAALTDQHLDLRYLKLVTPRLRANATGSGPGGPVAISTRISDLGILAPGFGGPATARGDITLQDRLGKRLAMTLDATGPGPTTARINGTLFDYGQTAALDVRGTAPLGLANRFIAPRSINGDANFNLRIDGPPGLSALSGQVDISNGRLALPVLRTAFDNVNGTVSLAAGRAETNIRGTAGTGGGFTLRGPITLTAPYASDLEITLANLGLSDARLYTTALNGTVRVSGPLTGGAAIAGQIALARTELRVPSGSGTISSDVPDIRHIGEPAAVAATRRRAGLITTRNGPPAVFPLNLTINAPNQIFVRGRGLDAELGGRLQLGGTTANVVASGLFELIRGRLDILGRRLELTEGQIDLRGALDPYVRFVAETSSDDVTVRVILEGRASSPNVSFTSDPDMPQEEAVSRLLFGRGIKDISPFQAAQIVSAAAGLSGQRSGGLIGGFREAIGLSDLDVTTTEDGQTQLKAGAYLSENIYSEVTTDNSGEQEINLKLDVSPSLTVKGSTNTAGETGIGVFFEKDY